MVARFSIGLAAAVGVLPILLCDERKPEAGVTNREPWTTSRITGSPEPPPKYKSTRVFPNVKLTQPVLIARAPGTDRLFVGERRGLLYSIKSGPDAKADLFCDLPREIKTIDRVPGAKEVGDLYGLVFHPKFEENRYCYVCYVLDTKDPKARFLAEGTRVSRFTVTKTDPPRIDPASEELVIAWQGGGHNGGDLHFGPDGMLYISSGDGRGPNPPDPLNTGQDCSDLLSSIMRIDVNTRDPGKNYAVPRDNPFVGMRDVRPELWAFGFRNPWRMSFDRQTGDLWVGDVGWELWEMVYRVKKGGNYGWSITEGRQPAKPNQKIGPSPILAPTIELPHTIAASVTGGYVYRGKKFPELAGAYIFGDWETRRIWAARIEGDRVTEMPEIVKPNVRVTAFGEDNAGELYYLDYDSGYIFTLDHNGTTRADTKFPTKLSETGLFVDVKKQTPANGVVSFRPNSRQWQDGADADYLLALPGTSSVSLFDKPRPLPGQVYWHNFRMQFPKDAVLVKSITLSGRRIETQVLHHDGEDWRGYTYAWRDDGTDADLVPTDGAEKWIPVADPLSPGGRREQLWTFHSRNQCLVCHNSWSEYTLAFSPGQLNGAGHRGGANAENQLVRFSRQGIIRRLGKDNQPLPPFDPESILNQPVVCNPEHSAHPLELRARSYLHVNCAHCHRFGGGGGQVVLELDVSRPLDKTGILDEPPKQGDFGIPDARILAPGSPQRSILMYRMAKFGRGRMPHLGSELPDFRGLELMEDWIGSLGTPPIKRGLIPVTADGVDKSLGRFETALPFARALGGGIPPMSERAKIIAAAEKLEPGPIRELFEGYFPPDPNGRKLGPNPRPTSILALAGNAKNGEAIFLNKEMKCINCHKVGDKGLSIGPDLSVIGKTRTRAELLDSLLYPSARVEPRFAAYLVRTKDEKTFTGLLVKRDEKQLVLKDSENKEIVLAAEEIETVSPSQLSLMPDGQMSGLTAQQAADLLEYLVQRK
jgi:putative heme-binding domain-containing protein